MAGMAISWGRHVVSGGVVNGNKRDGILMKTQWIVVAAAGLVLGLVATALWRQPDVSAQVPPAKVAYEYKVVEFGDGPQNSQTAEDMTKKVNKLAEEGWEYVGPVANASEDRRFLQGFVLFRKAKK
jgi:hypothetical protein